MYTTFRADDGVHEMYTNIACRFGASWNSVVLQFKLRHTNEML